MSFNVCVTVLIKAINVQNHYSLCQVSQFSFLKISKYSIRKLVFWILAHLSTL